MKDGDLVLTVFKVNVQTGSQTQNSRWLDEIHYDNPAWINPAMAKARGIASGDRIVITSALGEMEATARVTHAVAPWAIALSTHCGRTEYGRFASDKRSPAGVDDTKLDRAKWWKRGGVHANGIIPKSADPVSGQQCWMDTVVTAAQGASLYEAKRRSATEPPTTAGTAAVRRIFTSETTADELRTEWRDLTQVVTQNFRMPHVPRNAQVIGLPSGEWHSTTSERPHHPRAGGMRAWRASHG
jgi:hypothetical protein